MSTPITLVVIIPANNEETYITACLQALVAQTGSIAAYVIVSANACQDRTVDMVRSQTESFATQGHELVCLDSDIPGKTGALNRAEAAIPPALAAAPRIYLDADVICEPDLLHQTARALATDQPCYATGRISVQRSPNFVTRAYARVWVQLPFVRDGAVGAGYFALNAAGRARFGAFPDIISDDTFVRLNFTPAERVEVAARHHWPMVEGYGALVRVRRRQDAGVREVYHLYPDLKDNEAKAPVTPRTLLGIFLSTPFSFMFYMVVHVAVRRAPATQDWSRGR